MGLSCLPESLKQALSRSHAGQSGEAGASFSEYVPAINQSSPWLGCLRPGTPEKTQVATVIQIPSDRALGSSAAADIGDPAESFPIPVGYSEAPRGSARHDLVISSPVLYFNIRPINVPQQVPEPLSRSALTSGLRSVIVIRDIVPLPSLRSSRQSPGQHLRPRG